MLLVLREVWRGVGGEKKKKKKKNIYDKEETALTVR